MKKLLIILSFILLLVSTSFSQDEFSMATDFLGLLLEGKYVEATEFFDDSIKPLVPPEKLKEIWEGLLQQVGEFEGIVSVRDERSGIYRIVYVTSEFALSPIDIDIELVFTNMKIVGLFFQPAPPRKSYNPPSYVDPTSFEEKDVKIGKGDFILPGKLVIPKGEGPFPIVILVHGSGPNDMDESIGPNKPFRDLSWGLASLGIASLRYDKRTKVYPEKFSQYKDGFTVMEEVIEDVLNAVEFVKNEEKIDKSRIFVLGHSLGGMLAPRIASLSKDVKGIIIMAGPTRSLEDLMWEQSNYLANLDGKITEDEEKELSSLKSEIEKIKGPDLSKKYALGENILGAPVKYWLDLKSYNPVETAKSLEIPILILQGERDYQVTLKDLEGWEDGLSDKENVEFKRYPKLNHLFIEGEGKSDPAEYYKEGHIPEYVIKDIGEWIISF